MCASCSGSGGGSSPQPRRNPPTQIDPNCNYTYDQISNWNDKLKCVKEKDLFSVVGVDQYTVNSYLGLVQSALNSGQICYFASYFDNILITIQNIVQNTNC